MRVPLEKTLSVILAAYLPCAVDIPELPPDIEEAVLTFVISSYGKFATTNSTLSA